MSNKWLWLTALLALSVRSQATTCNFEWGDYVMVRSPLLAMTAAASFCSSLTRDGTTAQFPTFVAPSLISSLQSLVSVCNYGFYTEPIPPGLSIWYTSTFASSAEEPPMTFCPILDTNENPVDCESQLRFICVFNSKVTVTNTITTTVDTVYSTISTAVSTDTSVFVTSTQVTSSTSITTTNVSSMTVTISTTRTNVQTVTEDETVTTNVTEVDNTDVVVEVSLTSTTSVPTTTTVTSSFSTVATTTTTLTSASTVVTCIP